MPEPTGAKRDHPYVAHYDWPESPGDDRFALTREKREENAQHAADKQAVEGGRALRLVVAAPIVVWSFAGVPAFALFVLVAVLGLFGASDFDASDIDAELVWFFVLLALIEVASVWEATLLLRDRLSRSGWRCALILSVVAAVAVTAALAVWSPDGVGWLIVLALVWYCVAVALWQWRRSVRLASAVARLEKYSP